MGDTNNQCPRCSQDLLWGEISCKCGWRKRAARGEGRRIPREPVACAHEGCPDDATIRLTTRTGWANVCRAHYDAHWGREAAQAAAHLSSVAEKRAHIRELLLSIGTQKPSREWMDRINQRGVDILIATGNRRVLDELTERGVIEDDGRLVPMESRVPRAALPAPEAEAA